MKISECKNEKPLQIKRMKSLKSMCLGSVERMFLLKNPMPHPKLYWLPKKGGNAHH